MVGSDSNQVSTVFSRSFSSYFSIPSPRKLQLLRNSSLLYCASKIAIAIVVESLIVRCTLKISSLYCDGFGSRPQNVPNVKRNRFNQWDFAIHCSPFGSQNNFARHENLESLRSSLRQQMLLGKNVAWIHRKGFSSCATCSTEEQAFTAGWRQTYWREKITLFADIRWCCVQVVVNSCFALFVISM